MRRNKVLSYLITTCCLLSLFFSQNSLALPIDWHGAFGVDTIHIDQYRRTSEKPVSIQAGSQSLPEADSNEKDASFQSYIFRLNPTLIINDSVTFFAEMTTGYARGGILGDSSATRKSDADNSLNTRTWANALYYHNTSNYAANLHLNKFYMEIYSDTATIQVGRMPVDWGLGVIYNSGDSLWDRHTSTRDGISAKFKISNFHITPHWAKISSANQLVEPHQVTDYGITLLYDNIERDLSFGVLLGKRRSKNAVLTQTGPVGTISTAKVSIMDFYAKKDFGSFSIAAEVPLLTGELGHVFSTAKNTKYKANAIIVEAGFKFNEKWSTSLHAGKVSGANGNSDEFTALYLHPNYQVSNLMFRYNLQAVTNSAQIGPAAAQSIYDSYIVNADYARLGVQYNDDSWTWKAGFMYAVAHEVAKANGLGFNHSTNSPFTSIANQQKDYGYEIDAGVTYAWNNNLTVGADAGYHFVGDYYKFTNTSETQKIKDSFVAVGKVGVSF